MSSPPSHSSVYPGMTELPPLPSSSSLSLPPPPAASSSSSASPVLLFGKYTLLRKLGSGSFGDIYLGFNTQTGGHVAVKLEAQDMRWKQLCFESRLYSYLQGKPGPHTQMDSPLLLRTVRTLLSCQSLSQSDVAVAVLHNATFCSRVNCLPACLSVRPSCYVLRVLMWCCLCLFAVLSGIPKVYEFGDFYPYYVLVMELLGPSLEDLFNLCNRRFSVRCVCLVADQLLQRIELFHSKSFLHRDIKVPATPHCSTAHHTIRSSCGDSSPLTPPSVIGWWEVECERELVLTASCLCRVVLCFLSARQLSGCLRPAGLHHLHDRLRAGQEVQRHAHPPALPVPGEQRPHRDGALHVNQRAPRHRTVAQRRPGEPRLRHAILPTRLAAVAGNESEQQARKVPVSAHDNNELTQHAIVCAV